MNKLFAVPVIALMVAIIASGCTQRIGDFTIISSKNVEIGGKYKMLVRQEGVHKISMILGIPIGTPDLKQAVDNCIEAGKGDLLANAVIESNYWTAIVYGQAGYKVIGDVWGKASMSDLHAPDVELFDLTPSESGYELVSSSDPTKSFRVDFFIASR